MRCASSAAHPDAATARAAATGANMRGGLRRPIGPFQVICVLAAAGLAAALSPSIAQARQRVAPNTATPSAQALPDKPSFGGLGARSNADTIAIVSDNLNAA